MDERVKGRTDTGFEFDIPRTVLDDVEVVEAVVELEEKGATIKEVAEILKAFGKAGKNS